MDAQIKSNFRFSDNKVSLVVLAISVILAILLFVKIELVSRKTETKEAKLEDRIQRIEEELQNKVHKMFEQVYQSNAIPARRKSGEWDPVIWGKIITYCLFKPAFMGIQRRYSRELNPKKSTYLTYYLS